MKKSYFSSDDPECCEGIQIQLAEDGRHQQRSRCHKRSLWQVDNRLLCHTCFEHYLGINPDVDLASAVRLSDDESDFLEHPMARKSEAVRQFSQRSLCPQSPR